MNVTAISAIVAEGWQTDELRGDMNISYESTDLRSICEDDGCAEGIFGDVVANKIRSRLADIQASSTKDELVAGSPTVLGQGAAQCLRIYISRETCMYLIPLPIPPPLDFDGSVKWDSVTRIKIQKIGGCCDQS